MKCKMLAKTFAGLEEVLRDELVAIGASDVQVVIRGVMFTGSKEILYKANFCCRTAIRILMVIDEFKVSNSNDLYNGARNIEWSNYFDIQQTFSVNSTVHSEAFNNSMFVSLKTKDAIVDQFRAKLGKRPSVNNENPDIRINVHASASDVSISLDSSGESLHKRGYRLGQNEATMSEVLAAGILKIIGWEGKQDFFDPMCGSGTIAIEAALIARNIPPGIFRKSFAFEKWKDFDEDLFDSVYNADYEIPFEHKIYASDISSVNVKISSENARNAGLKKDIEFSVSDFATYTPPSKDGLLVVNPPYGQRMNDRKVEPLYNMIGDSLKKNFNGFKAWVFSASEDGFKCIGLRPSQKVKLFNGPLECELRLFELYEGSKKMDKQPFERKPFERKPYERKPYERKPYEKKPFEKKPYGTMDNNRRDGFRPRTNNDARPDSKRRNPDSRRRDG
jgi:putative N6-adenine-specific DNA methylase